MFVQSNVSRRKSSLRGFHKQTERFRQHTRRYIVAGTSQLAPLKSYAGR